MIDSAILPTPLATEPALPVATFYAPAGRDSRRELAKKAALVTDVPLLRQVLDAMPNMVLILNGNRQIVVANKALVDGLNVVADDVVGKRPGEVVGCIRASEGFDGCGTAQHCAACGAVDAILQCVLNEKTVVRECRILGKTADGVAAMDLKVTASRLEVDGKRFVMLALEDISQSKRLAVLQRTFFHDVLNTAGCIQGYADYLAYESCKEAEICQLIASLTSQLIESIQVQRDLTQAESGDLKLHAEVIDIPALLEGLRSQYCKHVAAERRTIRVSNVWSGVLVTDRRLLERVLSNLLKNALEATAAGNTITISCCERPEGAVFAVHNPEVIPHEIQLQLFQRSFSTKGEPGRGIGTYSVKLFGERYLKGKVDFTSQEPQGTTFTLTLPRMLS